MVVGLCHFVFSQRKDATRKDKKTQCENTKRRQINRLVGINVYCNTYFEELCSDLRKLNTMFL